MNEDDIPSALVVGEFSRARDGRLFVRAGRRTVNVQPAEDAVIELELTGPNVLEVVRAGDRVLGEISPVKGVTGQAKAKTLEFRGAKPFGEDPRPVRDRRKTTRPRGADDETGDGDAGDRGEDATDGTRDAGEQRPGRGLLQVQR